MIETRIKISAIVANQLPEFVREEFPLVSEFLSQYYLSLEGQGSTLDILQNIDQYVKVDNLTNIVDSTTLGADVSFIDDTITVKSTYGFPKSYGLIKIGSEIITYTGITSTTFTGCIRGFSGVTSYQGSNTPDELVFEDTDIDEHISGSTVTNLSVLFLKQFFTKVKKQITPGFENRELYTGLDERIFLKQSNDFYTSKGADQSFEILFRALYGEDVEVIKPRDYLFIPSAAEYRVSRDLVVELLEGSVDDLENRTLFQDETSEYPAASGSINKVEEIVRDGKTYYVISLDFDYDKDIDVEGSIFGKFSIHATTKVITKTLVGDTTIDVDSTVGFPSSGTLILNYSDTDVIEIEYKSKSLTQFYECSGISRDIEPKQNVRVDAFAYVLTDPNDKDSKVKVRVTGVISDLDFYANPYYYQPGDVIQNKNLGITLSSSFGNDWFFNIATKYTVDSISVVDNVNFKYRINTIDEHGFSIGNSANVIFNDGTTKETNVISILNKNSIIVGGQGQIQPQTVQNIQKLISKADSSVYPTSDIYSTNVQNVYSDKESLYVTSSSIPSYLNEPLDITDRSIKFSGTFNGLDITFANHGFQTGDSVTYIPESSTNTLNIDEGVYFVKRIDNSTIRLSNSRANISSGIYITLIGTVTNSILRYTDFAYQELETQKLIRKIQDPVTDSVEHTTLPGTTGILVNGVEILNYKSRDSIFYGAIQTVDILSNGEDYDIVNPPILQTTGDVGAGLSAFCGIEGSLDGINIIDPGFDYVSNPIVTISGGSGKGAVAKPILKSISHSVSFNSIQDAGLVNLTNNTIKFSSFHKFRDGELVIYKTDGQTAVGGLSTDAQYYASVQDAYTVNLHKNYDDAISVSNVIDLTGYGAGNHSFRCANQKSIISSISVVNPGSGYKNRKTTATAVGVDTSSNIITLKSHGYRSGELIRYTSGTTAIGGLTDGSYYVTNIDNNSVRLSQVGVGSTAPEFYYANAEYINFTSSGSGTQSFNYPSITVEVKGEIGVSTLTGQNFNAEIQPIFRGEVKSVFVEDGGVGYGSSEILNYNKQPTFSLDSGSGAQLKPIINDGKITQVLIFNSGSSYNAPPTLEVIGTGNGAILTPVISGGVITEVKVIAGGRAYLEKDTTIKVISAGKNAQFGFNPKVWNINIFDRLISNNKLSEDDGVIFEGANSSYGLQYTHIYSPRKLRRSILGTKIVNGQETFITDLRLQNGKEILSDTHSPIIGYAYDGNPIYGPYGYSTITGGTPKLLKSGYTLSPSTDRPNPLDSNGNVIYVDGFFINDYVYDGSGDLDEYNGRFCKTPEFPNGVYAYFTTINTNAIESSGQFKNYRKPEFPYFIGDKYKSSPIPYNYDNKSNQDDINLNETNLSRNTTPYGVLNPNTEYDFVVDSNKIQKQNIIVENTTKGKVLFVGINSGGQNYQVNDKVIFDNQDTGGYDANAVVSQIAGQRINNISIAKSTVSNVEFFPSTNQIGFIGFATAPHGLSNFDKISLSGVSTSSTNIEDRFFLAGIHTESLNLALDVESTSSTGIVTYFNVTGDLSFPRFRENDVLGIGTEKVRILNVDKLSSRIRVERAYDGTVGSAHTASSLLKENPRKLITGIYLVDNKSKFDYSRELYFDPQETVGVGTVAGVGIGSTLVFANPGAGISNINIPTKAFYLPDHKLTTGDTLTYFNNSGNSIGVSTDGIDIFSLTNGQTVYAGKISNDLIGIATAKIGIGTTGSFVGINSSVYVNTLFFTGIGTGEKHSLKTNPENILTATVNKISATVTTGSTHGLQFNDYVSLNVLPGITTTISVAYNDYHRRLVIDPRSFTASDVDTATDIITIANHNLSRGQKVIHTATTPATGLTDNEIYYVFVVSNDKIKLCKSITDVLKISPIFVNITGTSSGTISKINPPLILERNKTLEFDLSDSSLSFTNNSISYSAFDFGIFSDRELKNQFYSSSATENFEVTKSGSVGLSTLAKLTIKVTENLPQVLYYGAVPINLTLNTAVKKEITSDSDNIKNYNELVVVNNVLTQQNYISGIGSTTFSFSIYSAPSEDQYVPTDGELFYNTNSTTAYGSIAEVSMVSGGRNYHSLPNISRINSGLGTDATLVPAGFDIGKVTKVDIQDIGFEYSADKTLRPEAQLPQILIIDPYNKFASIGISSVGQNYIFAPDLVVLDGATNQVVSDVDLNYELGDDTVTISKNTFSLSDTTPTIIPINNTNGVSIKNITFDSATKDVTVSLGSSYSSLSDFPFAVGETVLIENVSVGVGNTVKGYNSSRYNYSRFNVTQMDPNIGGADGSITYNLSEYLASGEIPGIYDALNSVGRVIPSRHFPIFDITLGVNEFFKGEPITSQSSSGIVNSWNPRLGHLKVSAINAFKIGENVVGSSSKSVANIAAVNLFNSLYNVDDSSVVKKGWLNEVGFLNNNIQRLHDNDYYQYFSYALKSKVEYAKWDNAVSSLNHTAGFKKFSDLIVESRDPDDVGISTNQNEGTFIGIADFISEVDLNCVNDFDLATELTLNVDSTIASNEIVFNSRTLQDYIESVGNRVLTIDDLSPQFNDLPRAERFSTVNLFDISLARSKKYFVLIDDVRFSDEKQLSIVTLIHDDNGIAYTNEYGDIPTFDNLGSFEFNILGTEGQLLFYPTKYSLNDYNVSTLAYSLEDTFAGIGSTDFGDVVKVASSTTSVTTGISAATTIVGISSTYRASKLLVQYTADDSSYFEFDELTVIHDGSEVNLIEYGQLVSDIGTLSAGIGTYSAYLSGSNVNIDFTPNVALGVTHHINTIRVSIADTTSVGVGTYTMDTARLDSRITSIASTSSPVATSVAQYPSGDFDCAYYIATIEDKTNSQYQISEITLVSDSRDAYISEFGNLETGSSIGSFDAQLSGSNTELTFTPIASADVEVRVFQNALRLIDTNNTNTRIDLTNASVLTGNGDYTGTDSDIKREFQLTHKQLPIFERYFVGSASTVVSVAKDTIQVPNHFFVTGEELVYEHAGAGTTQAIEISSTNIPGVGVTDKLPTTVYAIKVDDISIKLAGSAENALKTVPTSLDITSVGIGTSHSLTAKQQNSRVVLSIDNVIQSPIVSSAVTTTLSEEFKVTENILTLSGITSIFGGNLLEIGNEVVRVEAVGVGSTNILRVRRSWMGTGISTHSSGELVTKVDGDYNIIDNKISFISPPKGLTPIGTTTGSPSDVDYVGIATHSTFSGRSFMRSGIPDTTTEPYAHNYVFDNVSSQFTGFDTSFNLKSSGLDVTGFSTDNAVILVNQIFQGPQATQKKGDYTLRENAGITSVNFTGTISSITSDINSANVPLGGVIVSVGSTEGFGYQPLVAAGGTATVSGLGTISSISIGNSGSGYRAGIQTVVNVGVATFSTGTPNIEFIGTAAISGGHIVSVAITNPGIGYTSTNPPLIIFDDPLSYSNIPLVYSSSSTSGSGSQATANIVVGQGSSIIEFSIKNSGYGYGQGEILTASIGGLTGIPTNPTLSYEEFQLTVETTYSDSFSGWSIGNLLVIDNIDNLFDGSRKSFPIKVGLNQKTIRSSAGSLIDVEATLLIFVNDILQVPGEGYTFDGGSFINFTEAPKVGDTTKILFYQGSSSVDVLDVDILETIKKGDTVRLDDDDFTFQQKTRAVYNVNSADTIDTNLYAGPGITTDESYNRPVKWCRQTEDKFVNGEFVAKDRIIYEPLIHPNTRIIQSVGVGSTFIFVENVRTFFDNAKENTTDNKHIRLTSQDVIVGASATAVVSGLGTISSISITGSGIGYTFTPSITIANPVGLGTTQRASANVTISGVGTVSAITVSSPGTGYTSTNPPVVLIEKSRTPVEEIKTVSYTGDFGIISGVSTTSVGVASTGIVFDLVIPSDSPFRDSNIVGTAITVSGIQTGYYFVTLKTNLGLGVTSLKQDNSVVGVGSTFLDNIYEVAAVSIAQTAVQGIGITYVAQVTVSVEDFNGLVGTGYSNFFGEYSWGRIAIPTRTDANVFTSYNNGLVGVSTSPIVERFDPLKYLNYN